MFLRVADDGLAIATLEHLQQLAELLSQLGMEIRRLYERGYRDYDHYGGRAVNQYGEGALRGNMLAVYWMVNKALFSRYLDLRERDQQVQAEQVLRQVTLQPLPPELLAKARSIALA